MTLGSLDTSRGFTLCVEAETHPGRRKYMEDYVAVNKLGLFEEGGGDSSKSTKACRNHTGSMPYEPYTNDGSQILPVRDLQEGGCQSPHAMQTYLSLWTPL